MRHYTEILSDFVYGLNYGDLPCETVKNTKRIIQDWYSACFAGMRVNGEFNSVVKEVMLSGASGGASVLLDVAHGYSECDAAFMNAVYAHGADMDDGNRLSMGHIAAHVISAVFSVAEAEGRKRGSFFSGKDIIVAVNAGYEIFNRVAAAAQPGLVKRGFHSTGTAGGMACAAAVAKLIGLGREGIYNAISLAALQSGGLIIIAESGQSAKPLNPANAARSGILSARMAEKGICAPRYPLESEKGWFHAMADNVEERRITEGLGERFTVDEGYLKPYPSCRHTHAAIEAALSLRRSVEMLYGDVPIEDIVEIRVHTYENAIRIAGQTVVPKSAEDAKFSIQYALAFTLVKGFFGIASLDINALTEEIATLAKKIRFIRCDDMEQADKGIRGAAVEVDFSDGRTFSDKVLIPEGDAATPLSDKRLREKLLVCSSGLAPSGKINGLIGRIAEFENTVFESVNQMLAE